VKVELSLELFPFVWNHWRGDWNSLFCIMIWCTPKCIMGKFQDISIVNVKLLWNFFLTFLPPPSIGSIGQRSKAMLGRDNRRGCEGHSCPWPWFMGCIWLYPFYPALWLQMLPRLSHEGSEFQQWQNNQPPQLNWVTDIFNLCEWSEFGEFPHIGRWSFVL
jgi:hypothetical protein